MNKDNVIDLKKPEPFIADLFFGSISEALAKGDRVEV